MTGAPHSPDELPTQRGLLAGQRHFDRFVLVRSLGRGGMGVVWRARDELLGEEVALKFLPDLVRWDPAAMEELKEETRRARALSHPGIVRIYDLVEAGASGAAIAMELIEGPTLTEARLQRPARVLEPEDIEPWIGELCAALDYAHRDAKIAHRDLKPSNLMLTAAGRIKVTDFGVARSLVDSMTRVSSMLSGGTILYMSPQQASGEPAAPADDIYALGATLYELLTGKPPFHTGDVRGQLYRRVPESMASRRKRAGIEGGAIPARWERIVARCLEKEPEKRPASAGALAAELLDDAAKGKRAAATAARRRAPRWRVALLAVVAVALAVPIWRARRPVGAQATVGGSTGPFPSDVTRAVAAWNLDGDGTDATGRGWNFILGQVVPTTDRHGRIDRALRFNGASSSQLNTPDLLRWDGRQPFTVALWIRLPSAKASQGTVIVNNAEGVGELYWALRLNDGRPDFYHGPAHAIAPDHALAIERLVPGQWMHLAAVFDGGILRVYIDGRMAGQTAASPAGLTAHRPAGARIFWGAFGDNDAERLVGDIDDLRVWRRALPAEEIVREADPAAPPRFGFTRGVYAATEDLSAVIRREFGDSTAMADWTELRRWHGDDTRAFLDELGMQISDPAVLVRCNGRETWERDPTRHYLVNRFNGVKPDYFLVHEELGGMTLALGSWFGQKGRVLVRRPAVRIVSQRLTSVADGEIARTFAKGDEPDAFAVAWTAEFARATREASMRAVLRLRGRPPLAAVLALSRADAFALALGDETTPEVSRELPANYDRLRFELVARHGRLALRAVSVVGGSPVFQETADLPGFRADEVTELTLRGVDAAELVVEK